MKFYAYEIAYEDSYLMFVGEDEQKVNEKLNEDMKEEGEEPETIACGTVEADDIDQALDKVRFGQWEYSQLA